MVRFTHAQGRVRALVVTVMLGALGLAAVATASAQSGVPPDRLAGGNRFDTAVAISEHAFPDGSLEVYIANAELNPDALVGGALTKGPVLLVPQCGTLPGIVADEIERLAPFRVYALGGGAVVCDAMVDQAAAAAPNPQDQPPQSVTRSGEGEGATTTFELNGGSYLVEYDFKADCFYGAFLESVDGQGQSESLPSGDGPVSGSTYIHNVVPGEYAIDMITGAAPGCPWTIGLTSE